MAETFAPGLLMAGSASPDMQTRGHGLYQSITDIWCVVSDHTSWISIFTIVDLLRLTTKDRGALDSGPAKGVLISMPCRFKDIVYYVQMPLCRI